MASAKIQISTDSKALRDIEVRMTHQTSGKTCAKTPFRDGTTILNGIEEGRYRLQVKHPNMPYDIYDEEVVVYGDRQTFIPVRIPADIFENAPIADTPEADLGRIQTKLDEVKDAVDAQANKLGGQPIYASDWNVLATMVGQVAHTTKDLTDLVSPVGHDHPELAAKFEEVQRNLQRMYDAFAQVLAELQRQIQLLALQRKIEVAVDRMPSATPEETKLLEGIAQELRGSWNDRPSVYTAKMRRAAQKITRQVADMLDKEPPDIAQDPDVQELLIIAEAMSKEPMADTYEDELIQQRNRNRQSNNGTFFEAMKTAPR